METGLVNHPPLGLNYGQFSPQLRRWVWKSPHHRQGILQAVYQFSRWLPERTRVLDAGAGSAPYRELFDHCAYKTSDHIQRTPPVDVVCPLHACPLPDQSFDAIVCTEVLEHVPDPVAALTELWRLLVPGGYLCLTVPFMLGVHEVHDYTRFTPSGLSAACARAGFEMVVLTPRYGLPMTLWSMVWAIALRLAHPDRNMTSTRAVGRFVLGAPMLILGALSYLPMRLLDRLDKTQEFTLGYAAVVRRPIENTVAAPNSETR